MWGVKRHSGDAMENISCASTSAGVNDCSAAVLPQTLPRQPIDCQAVPLAS